MGIKLRQFVFLSKNIFLPTKTLNGTLGVRKQNLWTANLGIVDILCLHKPFSCLLWYSLFFLIFLSLLSIWQIKNKDVACNTVFSLCMKNSWPNFRLTIKFSSDMYFVYLMHTNSTENQNLNSTPCLQFEWSLENWILLHLSLVSPPWKDQC